MTYIVGIKHELPLGREGERLLAASLREMAERHASIASTIGLTPEQRKAIRDNASIARTNAARVVMGRRIVEKRA